MKSKLIKFAEIATLGFALAFTFSCSSGGGGGCDDDGTCGNGPGGSPSGGGGIGPGGSLGNNLTLSGQVYIQEINYNTMNYKYTPYTGPNKTFTSEVGGTGSITGGKMSFSTGVPSDDILEPFKLNNDDEFDAYSDARVVPNDTRGADLDFEGISLEKTYINIIDIETYSMTSEMVYYTYVDKDCTITATGGTQTIEGKRVTIPNLNLNLKKGWNAVNMKIDYTATTGTVAISTGDLASAKWVLDDGYGYGVSSKNLSQLVKTAKLGIQKAIK